MGDKALNNPNVRGLVEHFLQVMVKLIESVPEWIWEAELQKEKEWVEFLKCPFGLERSKLWFYYQVRSPSRSTEDLQG